jgi:hypothetical protein
MTPSRIQNGGTSPCVAAVVIAADKKGYRNGSIPHIAGRKISAGRPFPQLYEGI